MSTVQKVIQISVISNEIHKIFRAVSPFTLYISYYIAENRLPLGQCRIQNCSDYPARCTVGCKTGLFIQPDVGYPNCLIIWPDVRYKKVWLSGQMSAGLGICSSIVHSKSLILKSNRERITLIALYERTTVSDLLPSLFKKEWPWRNHSCHSLKNATMSDLLPSLLTKERQWANRSFCSL